MKVRGSRVAVMFAAVCATFGALSSVVSPDNAAAATTACRTDTFELDADGWATHYAGNAARSTAAADQSTASLAITGAFGTARKTVTPGCPTISQITLRLRPTAASRLIFSGVTTAPNPPFLDPPAPYAGPFDLSPGWQTVTVNVNVPATVDLHVEITQPPNATTYLDNVTYLAEAPSTTTAPPTTTPSGICRTDTFDNSFDGWTTWWSGTLTSGADRITLPGGIGTAQRTVRPADCPGLQSVTLFAHALYGNRTVMNLYLKTVDIGTGAEVVNGPYPVAISEAANPSITVPVALGGAGVRIHLEVYSNGSPMELTEVRYNAVPTATTPPTTTPPTTTPPTTTPPTSTPTTPCATDTFASSLNGWERWWSGSVDRVGAPANAMRLAPGSGASAIKAVSATSCPTLQAITFDAALTGPGATGALFVKVINEQTGAASVTGPLRVTATGTPAPINVEIPASMNSVGLRIGIETYGSAAMDITNVRYLSGTNTRTTCRTETIAVDGGGFNHWWDRAPGRSLLDNVSHPVPQLDPAGTFSTARTLVYPGACAGAVVAAQLTVQGVAGNNLQVRRINLATGAELPELRFDLNGLPQTFEVPLNVGTAGVLLGLESWTPGPSLALSTLTQMTLSSDATASHQLPAAPRVTVTDQQLREATATLAPGVGGGPVTTYRTTLHSEHNHVTLAADGPGTTVTFDLDAHLSNTCFAPARDYPTCSTTAGPWSGSVKACNDSGCGPETPIIVSQFRPLEAGVCRIDEYEPGEDRGVLEWKALSTGEPTLRSRASNVMTVDGPDNGSAIVLATAPTGDPSVGLRMADAQALITVGMCGGDISVPIARLKVSTYRFDASWIARVIVRDPRFGTVVASGLTNDVISIPSMGARGVFQLEVVSDPYRPCFGRSCFYAGQTPLITGVTLYSS